MVTKLALVILIIYIGFSVGFQLFVGTFETSLLFTQNPEMRTFFFRVWDFIDNLPFVSALLVFWQQAESPRLFKIKGLLFIVSIILVLFGFALSQEFTTIIIVFYVFIQFLALVPALFWQELYESKPKLKR